MSTNLFTVGYEGLSLPEFIKILRKHHIHTLVDVRELPLSRKPGFSKTKLSQALNQAGIEYQSVRTLGSPRALRHEFKATKDWPHFAEKFSEYLKSQTDILEKLAEQAHDETLCLMCFEKDNTVCHRSIVAGKVLEISNNDLHIQNL